MMASWCGSVPTSDSFKYLVKHEISKLNVNSTKLEWKICLSGLKNNDGYIWNERTDQCSELFPSHLWTFLHHAAYHSAPIEIIQQISIKRFPMSLPDAEGKLAVEHVQEKMSDNYRDLFRPVYKLNFAPFELKLTQMNFHAVILDLVSAETQRHNLILPVLSVFLEDISTAKEIFFEIPDTGENGFLFWFVFEESGEDIVSLLVQTSCRGNIELYECRSNGWTLLESRQTLM